MVSTFGTGPAINRLHRRPVHRLYIIYYGTLKDEKHNLHRQNFNFERKGGRNAAEDSLDILAIRPGYRLTRII